MPVYNQINELALPLFVFYENLTYVLVSQYIVVSYLFWGNVSIKYIEVLSNELKYENKYDGAIEKALSTVQVLSNYPQV